MNKTDFVSAKYTAGQLNAMVKLLKKQAGEDGPYRFLRGEVTVSETERAWREQDGVIYFSVTSDGTTGEDWVKRLEDKNFRVTSDAESVLRSSEFKPTDGVTTEIAILKGLLFSDHERNTKKIRAEADKRGYTKPGAEVACLIRKKFTDDDLKAMGLWGIVAMHEPINDSYCDPLLLSALRDDGYCWLHAVRAAAACGWGREYGFAFASEL